jgi:hypothetical protein
MRRQVRGWGGGRKYGLSSLDLECVHDDSKFIFKCDTSVPRGLFREEPTYLPNFGLWCVHVHSGSLNQTSHIVSEPIDA